MSGVVCIGCVIYYACGMVCMCCDLHHVWLVLYVLCDLHHVWHGLYRRDFLLVTDKASNTKRSPVVSEVRSDRWWIQKSFLWFVDVY